MLVAFGALLVSVMLMIWFERKVISDMQNRIGPNRAGPFGILQTLADGIKLFFKEDLLPERADRFVFKLAPYLVLIPALLIFTIVPVGGVVTVATTPSTCRSPTRRSGSCCCSRCRRSRLRHDPRRLGLGLEVPAARLGPRHGADDLLRGGARAHRRRRSSSSPTRLSTRAIVDSQAAALLALERHPARRRAVRHLPHRHHRRAQPPAVRPVEGESELVGGFHTEYSSIRFALFFLAEFMNTITMSAIMVTLFFGGPDGPGFHFLNWLCPILWFLGKTVVFCFVYVWIRAALPRLRYDQLMDLGWKQLIPISLAWLLVIAGVLISSAAGAIAIFAVCCLAVRVLLGQAIRVAAAPPLGRRRGRDRRLAPARPAPATQVGSG